MAKTKSKLMYTSNEWTFETLDRAMKEIEKIAVEELGLDCYPNQIEIITSDQMLDAYSSTGLPLMYNHWSFGKRFIKDEHNYRKGYSGLAYEIVLNTSPTISYLMEENTMTMQTLVLAHAAFGHNHFFKNNYLFKQWTDASSILDYLAFAKKYIKDCEEKYGYEAVERTLDSAHALQNYGIDKYKRPSPVNAEEEKRRIEEKENELQKQVNELWSTLPIKEKSQSKKKSKNLLPEPEENILYFLEKKSPILETWQREILRIVRKISIYLHPQGMSKVLNEGFATFTHYHIMYRLWEKDLISDGNMEEFLHSHTNVVYQPPFDSKRYNGINPYALGFSMLMDIKRICTEPTEEDKEWFPDLIGKNYMDVIKDIVDNYRDESAILQFLSPKLIRDWHLFLIDDETSNDYYTVSKIHNERGYKEIRQALAASYNPANYEPEIQITSVNFKGDRTLTLHHNAYNGVRLHPTTAEKVLQHMSMLWGYNVKLISFNGKTGEHLGEIEVKRVSSDK